MLCSCRVGNFDQLFIYLFHDTFHKNSSDKQIVAIKTVYNEVIKWPNSRPKLHLFRGRKNGKKTVRSLKLCQELQENTQQQ